MQEIIDRLEDAFLLHMKYEYPQIDEVTARYLAFELAMVATGVFYK